MQLIHPFSFISALPRSLRGISVKSLSHSNSRSLGTGTLESTKRTVYTLSAKATSYNKKITLANALSLTRALSNSSTLDAAPLHLPEFKHQTTDALNLKFEKLKELSYFVVKRSPTRHFSQKQFDRAQELCDMYYKCDPKTRFQYLIFLADDFATSLQFASSSAKSFLATQNRQEPFDASLLVDRLRNQIRPRYLELFRHISRLDNGVKFLVDLRGDLITVLGNSQLLSSQHPSAKVCLRLMSGELSDLLSLWFSAGFLRLERVTWDSPTSILQKISEYEAVHPVRNWIDLKNRVGLYRRCYMFSHSCLPGEPLVILHVALVPDISSSIQEIILKTSHSPFSQRSSPSSDEPNAPTASKLFNPSSFSRFNTATFEDPNRIDAAVFYSISSTQKGLNGIDLGHAMIQQVAGALRADFEKMSQFSSLSPIPNFTEYLLTTIQSIQRKDESKNYQSLWQNNASFSRLQTYVEGNNKYAAANEPSEGVFWQRMIQILRSGDWFRDETLVELLEQPLMRVCAHYLHNEKRRGYALNSVANFHLKNGAVMWRLNWLADISSRGISNSCGMMINYRYFLENTEDNSQTYLNEKHIVAGEQFLKWLQ